MPEAALLLAGCDGADHAPGPNAAKQGEVQALADAESMLAERDATNLNEKASAKAEQ